MPIPLDIGPFADITPVRSRPSFNVQSTRSTTNDRGIGERFPHIYSLSPLSLIAHHSYRYATAAARSVSSLARSLSTICRCSVTSDRND